MVGWIDLGQLQRGGAIRREREVLHPVQQQLSREAALGTPKLEELYGRFRVHKRLCVEFIRIGECRVQNGW